MPTGLQIKNDNGDICIDEEYRNFTLKTSGSATIGTTDINTPGAVYAIYKADIAVTNCTSPVIALRATTDYVSVLGTTVSGSTYTFTVASNTSNFSFDYWVFDVASLPADTFGFEVYNSTGALVFHSSNKALRVVGAYDASGTGGTANVTLTAGRTYAVVQGANGWRFRDRSVIGVYRYTHYCAGHKFSGTDLYVPYPAIGTTMPANAPLKIDHYASGSTVETSYTPAQVPKFIAIDVTNF